MAGHSGRVGKIDGRKKVSLKLHTDRCLPEPVDDKISEFHHKVRLVGGSVTLSRRGPILDVDGKQHPIPQDIDDAIKFVMRLIIEKVSAKEKAKRGQGRAKKKPDEEGANKLVDRNEEDSGGSEYREGIALAELLELIRDLGGKIDRDATYATIKGVTYIIPKDFESITALMEQLVGDYDLPSYADVETLQVKRVILFVRASPLRDKLERNKEMKGSGIIFLKVNKLIEESNSLHQKVEKGDREALLRDIEILKEIIGILERFFDVAAAESG